MAQHTPTPWKLAGATHIYAPGENGANICSVSEPRASTSVGYTPLEIGSKDSAEAFANADFIVRACNVHDELVAALNEATDFLLAAFGQVDNPSSSLAWSDGDAFKMYWQARAALKKAGG